MNDVEIIDSMTAVLLAAAKDDPRPGLYINKRGDRLLVDGLRERDGAKALRVMAAEPDGQPREFTLVEWRKATYRPVTTDEFDGHEFRHLLAAERDTCLGAALRGLSRDVHFLVLEAWKHRPPNERHADLAEVPDLLRSISAALHDGLMPDLIDVASRCVRLADEM